MLKLPILGYHKRFGRKEVLSSRAVIAPLCTRVAVSAGALKGSVRRRFAGLLQSRQDALDGLGDKVEQKPGLEKQLGGVQKSHLGNTAVNYTATSRMGKCTLLRGQRRRR